MQLAALLLFLVAFAAYPVVALVRRLRRPLAGPGDQGRAAAQRRRARGGARVVRLPVLRGDDRRQAGRSRARAWRIAR